MTDTTKTSETPKAAAATAAPKDGIPEPTDEEALALVVYMAEQELPRWGGDQRTKAERSLAKVKEKLPPPDPAAAEAAAKESPETGEQKAAREVHEATEKVQKEEAAAKQKKIDDAIASSSKADTSAQKETASASKK